MVLRFLLKLRFPANTSISVKGIKLCDKLINQISAMLNSVSNYSRCHAKTSMNEQEKSFLKIHFALSQISQDILYSRYIFRQMVGQFLDTFFRYSLFLKAIN